MFPSLLDYECRSYVSVAEDFFRYQLARHANWFARIPVFHRVFRLSGRGNSNLPSFLDRRTSSTGKSSSFRRYRPSVTDLDPSTSFV